jgi:tetratricopeptide (TPR) repeat protein
MELNMTDDYISISNSSKDDPVKDAVSLSVEELVLRLNNLKIETKDGKRRAEAFAHLVYEPANKAASAVESGQFDFTAPLGVIEAEDLRWYLEEYLLWPIGVFKERAKRIENQLPRWGQDLYESALGQPFAQEALSAWQQAGIDGERRFSVFVDSELPDGASEEDRSVAREAATELLSLPWELLHDGRGFLFHGNNPVRVRRRLPARHRQPVRPTRLPIRILLVSPRPEEAGTEYMDHRISALPLVEAMESLGESVELTILAPPIFPALKKALQDAAEAERPFDVVHFDGHGIYDPKEGQGGLCFEDPNDTEKLEERAMQWIEAKKMGEIIRDHRTPLVFLEACQSAKTDKDPSASVAANLLEEGVNSVVAMSHSIQIEASHRYVKAFYKELAEGKRVGTAMLAGQRELYQDTYRGKMLGAGDLHLQDWFVPVLFQEEQDPQLVIKLQPNEVQAEEAQRLRTEQRQLSLGELPDPPAHEFQGRSRELLALERLLHRQPYAVARGQGGAGKSTLAIELARWLVRVGRFRQAAFVSLEQYTDARSVLDSLSRQLLAEGSKSVAQYADLEQAFEPVKSALAERATIIVLDNLESVLPDRTGQLPPGAAPIEELFELCNMLLETDPATRIVFTSREVLFAPFDDEYMEIPIGPLSREDAIKLVAEVIKKEDLTLKSDDLGSEPREIIELVEAVNCHARALVLLAREVSRRGVRATTESLHQLMAELDKQHPDDRENSLYASVELSLRRLPPDAREHARALSVFHGGAHLNTLAVILDVDRKTVDGLASHLIEVGLAEATECGHLCLDPALPSYLLRELSQAEQEALTARWAEGMKQLTALLYEHWFKNANLVAELSQFELHNLMALLRWMQDRATPEETIRIAKTIESLFSQLSHARALAEATRVREQAAQRLGDWSHIRFLTEGADIDGLLERGESQAACDAAQYLLERSLAAGEEAFPEAAYNIGLAYFRFGRTLNMAGAAEAALAQLTEAQRRFQALADAGSADAERMASVATTDSADCLVALGRLDEAAAAYENAIRSAEKRDDIRQIATIKFQLGTARIFQQRYDKALKIYNEIRVIFENLGELKSVASVLHQIGMIYRETEQFEEAERAYRQSLAIRVQERDLVNEASSLSGLGGLYSVMGRLEDAVNCIRQAADIYTRLQYQLYEGNTRNNLADTLVKLQRYDEARRELYRAIECKKPYGLAVEPWKTWAILYELEQGAGNPQAAAQARQQAIDSYLAYRRAGGQSMSPGEQLRTLAEQAIKQGDTTLLDGQLTELLGTDIPPSVRVLIPRLHAILHGERNPAIADDPNLVYDDAVELQLLLEELRPK